MSVEEEGERVVEVRGELESLEERNNSWKEEKSFCNKFLALGNHTLSTESRHLATDTWHQGLSVAGSWQLAAWQSDSYWLGNELIQALENLKRK